MQLTKSNIILAVIGGLTVIAAIYYYGFYNKDSGPAVIASSEASSAESDFIRLQGQIINITFDQDIFSDPRFTRLTDIHTVIVPEAAGRRDPFAPLAGAAAIKK